MKLAWFTVGDRTRASSRLRAWGIADRLPFESTFNDLDAADSADVVIVQKKTSLGREMRRWMDLGKPVVWDCDDPTSFEPPEGTIITTPGTYYGPGISLPGLVDVQEGHRVKTSHGVLNRVCWFGDPLNQRHAYPVVVACERLRLECVLITDVERQEFTGCTYLPWSLETIDADILSCDLVACPFAADGSRKGENKLAKAWALGMPVAGTPVPSYLDYGLRWRASTTDEWVDVLTLLRCPERRAADADLGRATVEWHQRKVIPAWEAFLRGLVQ